MCFAGKREIKKTHKTKRGPTNNTSILLPCVYQSKFVIELTIFRFIYHCVLNFNIKESGGLLGAKRMPDKLFNATLKMSQLVDEAAVIF